MNNPRARKEDRIAKYLEAIPGAIAGAGGHKQTFKAACSLYNGWALTEEETLAWLKVYNAKCNPLWTDKELEHKAKDVARAKHNKPRGYLLGESGSAFEKEAPDWTLPTKPMGVWKIPATLATPNSISICTTVTFTDKRVEIENTVANVANGVVSGLVSPENGEHSENMEPLDPEPVSILDPEARRIDGELAKLSVVDGIKNDEDAKFYDGLIKTFDATFHPVDAAGTDEAPPGLTSEQLVPDPPRGLSSEERAAYYEADLRDATGEEYIDHDYRPPARPDRSSTRKKKRSPRKTAQ
jgi:hypothetical protein